LNQEKGNITEGTFGGTRWWLKEDTAHKKYLPKGTCSQTGKEELDPKGSIRGWTQGRAPRIVLHLEKRLSKKGKIGG